MMPPATLATAGPRYTPYELAELLRLPTRLLTEASCWQLADAVTRAYAGDMSAVENAPATVTDAVLHLAAELSEHLRTPDDLAAWTGRFTADINAPAGKMYADVARMRSAQQARPAIPPLR